jgi:hypothetical protein
VRTTIDLAPDVYDIVRRRAFEERRSMGDVLSELARSGLRGAVARRPIGRFDGHGSIADDFDLLPDEVGDALVTDLT